MAAKEEELQLLREDIYSQIICITKKTCLWPFFNSLFSGAAQGRQSGGGAVAEGPAEAGGGAGVRGPGAQESGRGPPDGAQAGAGAADPVRGPF